MRYTLWGRRSESWWTESRSKGWKMGGLLDSTIFPVPIMITHEGRGGLNEPCCLLLMCVNTWPPSLWRCVGEDRDLLWCGVSLEKGHHWDEGFQSCTLCPVYAAGMWPLSCFLLSSWLPFAAMAPTAIRGSLSRAVSPKNLLFLKGPLIMVFITEMKVTNTEVDTKNEAALVKAYCYHGVCMLAD